jgi:branched-chain amino acid transport system permease protein
VSFFLIQLLNGLASASSLFLVASGLSIIFGVMRIVNFAHGSFYMLGAYIAYSLVAWLPRTPLGFWGGLILAALAVACIGTLIEILLLKRIYRAPELFQLLAISPWRAGAPRGCWRRARRACAARSRSGAGHFRNMICC